MTKSWRIFVIGAYNSKMCSNVIISNGESGSYISDIFPKNHELKVDKHLDLRLELPSAIVRALMKAAEKGQWAYKLAFPRPRKYLRKKTNSIGGRSLSTQKGKLIANFENDIQNASFFAVDQLSQGIWNRPDGSVPPRHTLRALK